jgi:hypothetical protein
MSAVYEMASVAATVALSNGARDQRRAKSDSDDDEENDTAVYVGSSSGHGPFQAQTTTLATGRFEAAKHLISTATKNTPRQMFKIKERQKLIFGFSLLAIGLVTSTIQTVGQ